MAECWDCGRNKKSQPPTPFCSGCKEDRGVEEQRCKMPPGTWSDRGACVHERRAEAAESALADLAQAAEHVQSWLENAGFWSPDDPGFHEVRAQLAAALAARSE